MTQKIVFMFDDPDPQKFASVAERKEFFGGKGAGLREMTGYGSSCPVWICNSMQVLPLLCATPNLARRLEGSSE